MLISSSSVRSPLASLEAHSRSQPPRHPPRKLLRTNRADFHCRTRPAGTESSVWKTDKAADKRVTRRPSGIRLDWSGNRTGNSVCRGSSIRTRERVDCSPVSLHVSKPSLRANYFKVPVGLPGNGRFWCVIQSTVQQPADFTAGPAGLEPATRPL